MKYRAIQSSRDPRAWRIERKFLVFWVHHANWCGSEDDIRRCLTALASPRILYSQESK